MKYIINTAYGSKLFIKDNIIESSKNNLSIIKEFCYKNLFSYEGYLKAVKKVFNKYYQIPIYFDNFNIFIPTKRVRDYENIWINYPSVILYERFENNIKFTFYDNTSLIVLMSYQKFLNQLKLIDEITNYKKGTSSKFDKSLYVAYTKIEND